MMVMMMVMAMMMMMMMVMMMTMMMVLCKWAVSCLKRKQGNLCKHPHNRCYQSLCGNGKM
jgi:hypothetical protein